MSKSVASDMIKTHFTDEFGPQRLPISASFGAPTAWTTWRFARETGRTVQSFQPLGQAWPFFIGDGGGEADMVEPTLIIVKPKK